jgi:hypothetical protein
MITYFEKYDREKYVAASEHISARDSGCMSMTMDPPTASSPTVDEVVEYTIRRLT